MTPTTHISRRLKALLATAALCAAFAAILPATSNAYIGEGKSLPYFHGSGYVRVTAWGPSGSATWHYSDGSRCVYIQYKHTAILGVDGLWHRLTSDNCGGYASSANWSAPTSLPYNGIKFRLCQDIPNASDSCGDAVNIGTSTSH